jgi:membrane protein implicated in regulation of membrane protease activity
MDTRLIAPGLFALLVILAFAGYAVIFLLVPIPVWIKLLFGLILTSCMAAIIYVFVQRARELKEEDKDDLGKY